ncbi:DNA-directed RNA polymerase subunit beta [Patescibacteria group bacterium]|nr:DNA-directed RNA polymerase subunit beta [Patescibacteria group bacterium]
MEKKYFSAYKPSLVELPPLASPQLDSFKWFLDKGLKELFDEFSPIEDYTGKELTLEFVGFSLDEPKCEEYHAKTHNLSYEAPLRIRVRLTNKKTKEVKEQEIFLADLPLMTPRGTFIVNGVERVIVSLLARSFGLYFTASTVGARKYFGAKIIPSRGAWIEMETDTDGVIYARIDRKRKFPISFLLRIMGLTSDEDIKKAFHDVDSGEVSYITRTLEKDPIQNTEEAFVEVYKRLRPGELATVENARELFEGMFSADRYDLSAVGRHKLNDRLGLDRQTRREIRVLTLDDFIAVVRHIIQMNNDSSAVPDDIDHLGNRRIRGVGEMLQQKLRIGMMRIKRTVQDRMSTLDIYTLTPAQLINDRPFMAAVKEFFTTNQLAQFMKQENILSELEHLRRLTAMGPGGLTKERAGFEVRDVHPSHYGRVCPIQTPEGPNIGLVVHLSSFARINELGILEAPYARVKNGVITPEIVYLTAFDEERYNIAAAGLLYDETGKILEDEVEGRIKSQPGLINRGEIDYVDISPAQAFSVSTSIIPFLEHDDPIRAMMGSNMQRQAVPCLKPAAPLVATGLEERIARDSGRLIISEEDGIVKKVDAAGIVVKSRNGSKAYKLINYLRSNDFTTITHRPIVNLDQKVKKGDILADVSSSDGGQLALGQNILVAFLSWGGANFEDAIVLSERLVKDDTFTSVYMIDFTIAVRDTKLGPEITTYDIPNVGEEKLKDLDEEGIVRIGAEVAPGDILVGKITPKGEVDLTPEERLLRAIFGEKAREVKDTSQRLPHGRRGRVVGVKIFSREKGDQLNTGIIKQIQVEIAQLRKISVGDKLSGRHGNKGVISKILPVEDMPFLEDGTPVDIILNPLGVASRMNIGQILETHLGWAADKLGYQAITPAFRGASDEEIKAELKKAGIPTSGKVKLFDGRYGEAFDQPVTVGQIYIMKLEHMVEEKIHMRSTGPYSLITQQPLGGKAQGGGQRFGEMEVWALEGYGAAYTLQEMLTIKSDDVLGRSSAYDAIVRGEPFKSPNLPASFHVLLYELRGLTLDMDLIEAKEQVQEAQEEHVEQKAVKEFAQDLKR